MKPQKILLFIILIIMGLALIAALFPSKGIRFFDNTLRFPTLTEITTRSSDNEEDPEDILNQWKETVYTVKENPFTTSIKNTNRKDTAIMVIKMEGVFEFPGEDKTYFDSFFAKAEAALTQHKIVRVLYYGDSQIEMDRFSSKLRQFFQQKFGGGGPGMTPFNQTIPNGTINQYCSGDYSCFSLWGDVQRNKEKDYGPLAKMYRINGTNTFTAYSPKKDENQYSNISLLINNLTGSFKAELSDKTNQAKYTTQTDTTGIQWLHFPLNFATQSFSVTMTGNANIYGVLIDNGFGVAVDNIAMRGAAGLHFTSMNDSLLRETYKLLNVGMIVLQYGGNAVPSLSGEKNVNSYVANIITQIRYLQRIAPNTPILFIGPSDMLSIVDGELKTYKQLPYLVERMSEEIPKSGAAFWNMYKIMGGANSMRAWVKKGWAGNDYVHFTEKGAQKIAAVLTETFENMYERYLDR